MTPETVAAEVTAEYTAAWAHMDFFQRHEDPRFMCRKFLAMRVADHADDALNEAERSRATDLVDAALAPLALAAFDVTRLTDDAMREAASDFSFDEIQVAELDCALTVASEDYGDLTFFRYKDGRYWGLVERCDILTPNIAKVEEWLFEMGATPRPEIEKLADLFILQYRSDLIALGTHDVPAVCELVDKKNASRVRGVDRWCATHDFIDSNETMIPAYRVAFDREPRFGSDYGAADDTLIVNAAWDRANYKGFSYPAPEKLDDLSDQLAIFCGDNYLPAMSADELVLEDGVSAAQRLWLRDFCQRWDRAEKAVA